MQSTSEEILTFLIGEKLLNSSYVYAVSKAQSCNSVTRNKNFILQSFAKCDIGFMVNVVEDLWKM
jgi:hypothetical protein